MKRLCCYIAALLLAVMPASSQPGALRGLPLTPAAKKLISEGRFDSLLRYTAGVVFKQYKTPEAVLGTRFFAIKKAMLTAGGGSLLQACREAEAKEKAQPAGSTALLRQRYADALEQAMLQLFEAKTELRAFLYVPATDRISYFNSTVKVQPDGKLLVTERITIYNGDGRGGLSPVSETTALGGASDEIQRGIIREFPTLYLNRYKLFQNTTFRIRQVRRTGTDDENYKLKRHLNGWQLYIGKDYYRLPKGYFTYTIEYETGFQLKYLENADELYWNVTGNGWRLRIDSATCTVMLPAGTRSISNACYTGKQGDTSRLCTAMALNDSTIVFKTRYPQAPAEGFTIAASWNKGVVQRPSVMARAWHFFKSNQAALLLPLLALLFGIYNFIAWWRVGRDPKPGVIVPQFYPPKGYSPAALGYIFGQQYSTQLAAATIIDLAVKKVFRIDVDKEGWLIKKKVYSIEASGQRAEPAGYHDFRSDADDLVDTVIKKGKYNSNLASLSKSIRQHCESNYKNTGKTKGFFTLNNQYMAPGNLLTTLGVAYIIFGVLTRNRVAVGWQLLWMAGGLLLCIFIQVIFYKLIKAYTQSGRKLMDEIEGFRMYLKAADEHRINMMNPPEKTIELYERYMPFAVALDCEIEWSRQFEPVLAAAAAAPATSGYSSSFSRSLSNDSSFGSSFTSSFSGAISSASTPPSSSSGGGSSFGGGSSGGGGGGGGGGGW